MRLHVRTSSWHEGSFSRDSNIDIFGLLNAVNAHFLHNSTDCVGRDDLGHTGNLALVVVVLAHARRTSLFVTDGPFFRCNDRM